jgi:hypothetical protein
MLIPDRTHHDKTSASYKQLSLIFYYHVMGYCFPKIVSNFSFWPIMERCQLCPRKCGVNKLKGERGFCGANARLEISAFAPHQGEEKPLRGTGAPVLFS